LSEGCVPIINAAMAAHPETQGIKTPALVERSVGISAGPADVWRAIVDPDVAPRWMGMRMVCSWEVGSSVTLTETPLGGDYAERGTLLAFEPGALLRYDHWSPLWRVPDVAGNRAVVTLRVEADGAGTRVLFRHELPEVEALAEHSDFFWRVGLAQLKRLMETRGR
jgi:uncharacterized protein YndB with AHSA1/START domain